MNLGPDAVIPIVGARHLKIPHLPAWLFRGISADFSQLTPSIRWQARFPVIIIS